MRLAIIGGGLAGTAAAWFATRAGAEVTLFDAGAGASAWTSGAVDLAPWEHAPATERIGARVRELVDALGVWRVDERRRAWVCTSAGVLRPARGRDAAVLDVGVRPGARIGVARVARDGWDADALAASLGAEPAARRMGASFFPVDVEWLRASGEATWPPGDLAALLDDPSRLSWCAARIAAARRVADFDALLVGPWLGASRSRADELARAAGVEVGETLSPVGGPAGERLVTALHALVPGVDRIAGRALVSVGSRRIEVVVADERARVFDACVLATGGLASGGLAYAPPDPTIVGGPPPRFRGVAWPDGVVAHGEPWEAHVWASEAPIPSLRWGASCASPLERVGLLHEDGLALGQDRAPCPHVAVAGDHAFGVPRTALGAVDSAARAVARLSTG